MKGFQIVPALCYWSGVEKYHMLVEGIGVDLSIRAAAQVEELRTWPTIHFPESAIVKDAGGIIATALGSRDATQLSAGLDNTLHGCLYHALSCAIQLRRGELVNARSRFSGVIETYICLSEETVVGQLRWREPSRRVESRLDPDAVATIRELAYAGSPATLTEAIARVLDYCEIHGRPTIEDRATIAYIRSLLKSEKRMSQA
jgi:hypothetical protein